MPAFAAELVALGVSQRAANVAVAAVRNYCGWHVIPPDDTRLPAGPGGSRGYDTVQAADAVQVAFELAQKVDAAANSPSVSGIVSQEHAGQVTLSYDVSAGRPSLTPAAKLSLEPYRRSPLAGMVWSDLEEVLP